jgi:hypothetical protein
VGISGGSQKSLRLDEGVPYTDNVVQHARHVGACYFSLWNWHRIQADRILNYYHQFPDALDDLARHIGYCVRPSWIWTYEERGYPGLIIGFVNDGIAGVPGVLRVSVVSEDGTVIVGGSLDAGYPLPGKVRGAKCNRRLAQFTDSLS